MKLLHCELVELGAKLLARTNVIVLTELTFGFESPDVIGWDRWGKSTVLECKTSLSDYHADAKKPFRVNSLLGMGAKRYFLTEPGLLEGANLPEQWGLIEVKNDRFKKKKETRLFTPSMIHENQLLISAVRRLGNETPPGVSVNFYKIDRQVRATLGVLC